MLSRASQGPAGIRGIVRLPTFILVLCAALLSAAGSALADGETLSLSQVSPGMNCTGETVVQGTTITSFARC